MERKNIIPTKVGIHSQTVEIYNLTGKLLKSFSFWEKEKGLNISDLKSGIIPFLKSEFYE